MQSEELRVEKFINVFRPALILYAVVFFLQLDCSFYDRLSNELYHPVGLFSVIGIPWPGLKVVYALLALAVLFGALSVLRIFSGRSTFIFALLILGLDGLHNMFGFVNAQIHLVFFLFGLSFMEREPKVPLLKAPGFHFCETVFVLVYFQSGLAKLLDGGLSWGLNGGTLQIGLIRQEVPIGLFIANFHVIAVLLSVAVLLFETLFPFLYWLNRRRLPIYIVSVLFHLGTLVLMKIDFFHLWVFSLTMILIKIDWKAIYEPSFKTTAVE